MNKSSFAATGNRRRVAALWLLIAALLTTGAVLVHGQAAGGDSSSDGALLEGFRHVEVASVSDAVEQITGKRMYMTHRMRPILPAKFAGYALTVLLKKDEGNHDSKALSGMVEAIDGGKAGSVYVMVVEDGQNIAGMGGLMGTAMAARDFSGAVIDGGVRDLPQLRKIAFPVFATGVVPSTSVGHYRFAGANVPVVCDGVSIQPGDIVTADADGVVVVPRTDAQAVLTLAEQMDFKEHSMYSYIEKYKSLGEAIRKFGRL
ncbi:MAG TPA: RraA family protein [Terriglobales bacterium]|nr:RraA family protein [Terriglobales bacterium]